MTVVVSSYKITRGSTGPPGYQVQLLEILMDLKYVFKQLIFKCTKRPQIM